METCGKELPCTRGGWRPAEEALLFDTARDARERGLSLKSVFDEVASATGRKPNSIRNHYYARIREGACSDAALHSAAFVPFTEDEVRALVRSVLIACGRGISVRACTLDLGGQDMRKMLRYQNKFRAVLKNDPALVREILHELEAEGHAVRDPYAQREQPSRTPCFDKTEAAAFFEALEALAAKYKRMVL